MNEQPTIVDLGMEIPAEVPVMTLPKATLFPQALLPLYIFEPRYRKMLADALHSHRMFIVAMQKPGLQREVPAPVAGLGLIRVSVDHKDGTSHLILQGLLRVELKEAVRYRPYRIQRIRPVRVPPCDSVAADALVAKVRELVEERVRQGLPFPIDPHPHLKRQNPELVQTAGKDVLKYISTVKNPEQLADLVSCAVLQSASARQMLLETANVEARLRRLVKFLLAEIRLKRKGDAHE